MVEIHKALGGIRNAAAAVGIQELASDDADVPVNPNHSQAIVAFGANGAGDVAAMPLVVPGVTAVGDGVNAVNVVDVAVVVVVFVVARNLAGVGPHVVDQVRMAVVNSGVDDSYDDILRAGGYSPGLEGVDVRVPGAAVLAGVVQAPQLGQLRVIGSFAQGQDVVRLGEAD